jgi:hypothetical protein
MKNLKAKNKKQLSIGNIRKKNSDIVLIVLFVFLPNENCFWVGWLLSHFVTFYFKISLKIDLKLSSKYQVIDNQFIVLEVWNLKFEIFFML